MSEEQTCVNHPNTPTVLRCNKCGSAICTRCAVQTPVGYRCKSCVKSQQAVFYTAVWSDYPIAAVTALIISGAAHLGLMFVPFLGILVVFAGLLIGGAVGKVTRRATGKRRGRYIWLVAGGGIIIGAVPAALLAAAASSSYGLIIVGISALLAAGAASAQLR